jgi:hypothetical protein
LDENDSDTDCVKPISSKFDTRLLIVLEKVLEQCAVVVDEKNATRVQVLQHEQTQENALTFRIFSRMLFKRTEISFLFFLFLVIKFCKITSI